MYYICLSFFFSKVRLEFGIWNSGCRSLINPQNPCSMIWISNYGLFNAIQRFYFLIQSLLGEGKKMCIQNFVVFLEYGRIWYFALKIYWPLAPSSSKYVGTQTYVDKILYMFLFFLLKFVLYLWKSILWPSAVPNLKGIIWCFLVTTKAGLASLTDHILPRLYHGG